MDKTIDIKVIDLFSTQNPHLFIRKDRQLNDGLSIKQLVQEKHHRRYSLF